MKKRRRRRRNRFRKWGCFGIVLIVVSMMLGMLWLRGELAFTGSKKGNINRDVNHVEMIVVDPPIQRTDDEVLDKLKELGQNDEKIKEICENSSLYPKEILAALVNNPEMKDFVYGYPSADTDTTGALSREEEKQKFPLFLQWDPRWGYKPYGDNIIGLAGCGPTCVSMVLFSFTRDSSLMPDTIAAYSMEHGHYVESVGTAWALMEDAPKAYGLDVYTPTFSENGFKNVLDDGGMLICSVGKGDFTTAGHFIVIYGYDADGFLINDPNCVSRSNKKWTFEKLEGQIRNVWAYAG